MKIKNLLSVFFALAISASTYGQANLLNSKTPDEIGKKTAAQLISDNDKPLPYGYVHDRDVLMGKTIWEFIDLDERINFPLYYPLTSKLDRLSLFEVLRQYVNNSPEDKIKNFVFEGNDDYFNEQSELIRQVAPFISEVRISASGEPAKSIYTNSTVKYPFDTATRGFSPCITATSIPCEEAVGKHGNGIYRLSLAASKHLLFYVNYNYMLAYNRPIIARHESGEIVFQSRRLNQQI